MKILKKKDLYTKVFDKEINYQMIMDKIEKRKKNYLGKICFASMVILLLLLVVGIEYKASFKEEIPILKKEEIVKDIFINEIDLSQEGLLSNDMDVKRVDGIYKEPDHYPQLDCLEYLILPEDLIHSYATTIYVRSNPDVAIYDKVLNYSYVYQNEDASKEIAIAFSQDHDPARDYYFSEKGSKKSVINGVEFTIFQYKDTFMTKFIHEDYHFDIESHGVSADAFTSLLVSMLQ